MPWITEPLLLLLVWLVVVGVGSFSVGYTMAAGRTPWAAWYIKWKQTRVSISPTSDPASGNPDMPVRSERLRRKGSAK